VLVKRALFLLNAALAIAILHLISQVQGSHTVRKNQQGAGLKKKSDISKRKGEYRNWGSLFVGGIRNDGRECVACRRTNFLAKEVFRDRRF
jgi:hypothetical protein